MISLILWFFFLPMVTALLNNPADSSAPSVPKRKTYACITNVKTERLRYEWTVNNFSLLQETKGEYISSPTIQAESEHVGWILRFFPQGYKNDGYAGFSLNIYSPPKTDFKVRWELSIMTASKVKFTKKYNHTYTSRSLYSDDEFLRRANLLNLIMPDDSFIIRVDIDMPMKTETQEVISADPLEKEMLMDLERYAWTDHLSHLFKNPEFSDVVIVARNERFSAHKNVLTLRSPVFAASLADEMSDPNIFNEVSIDVAPTVAKAMLEFIYTDDVENLANLAPDLLGVADTYQLPLLKTMCEMVVYKNLDVENAVDYWIITDRYNSNKLKKHIQKFITKHLHAVMDSRAYKKINETHTKLLTDLLVSIVSNNSP